MKIILWNCRGAGSQGFFRHLKEVVRNYQPTILCLVETRTNSNKACRVLRSFHFTNMAVVENRGFRGGIWCFWDANQIAIQVINYNTQYLNLAIVQDRKVIWILSMVYASPERQERQSLWKYYETIGKQIRLPWCIMGDIDEVLCQSDKAGGKRVLTTKHKGIWKMVNACELMDIGFSGPAYTWSNFRQEDACIQERLDRVWVNRQWQIQYQEAHVQHLTRTHSDHHPICLHTSINRPKRPNHSFRFQLAWLEHKDFENFVEENWKKGQSIKDTTEHWAKAAKIWNRTVFGHIFQRKQRCLARIGGIQNARARTKSDFLRNLEAHLLDECEEILKQEEAYWLQQANLKWFTGGERNTRYLHLTAIRKQRKKRIHSLLNKSAVWTEDPTELMSMARDFYQELYSTEAATTLNPPTNCSPPTEQQRKTEPKPRNH